MADNNFNVYINKRGEQVPRVSDILKLLAKEQIAMWANSLGFRRISYKQELDRTAKVGAMAHDIIEIYTDEVNAITKKKLNIIDYDKYGVVDEKSKKEVLNALWSFLSWYKDNEKNFKIVARELNIVGDFMGGTMDTVIRSPFNKDKVVIADYKTASSFYFSMFLQLAAYVILYEDEFGLDLIDGVMIIRLDKKDGKKAETLYISRKDLDPFLKTFNHLLRTGLELRVIEKDFDDIANDFEDLVKIHELTRRD